MIETQMALTKARERLSTIVENVQYQGEAFIISRHGKPAAALVPVQVYEKWKQERQEFFNLIREFQESGEESDPEEIMQEVLAAQQAVRDNMVS